VVQVGSLLAAVEGSGAERERRVGERRKRLRLRLSLRGRVEFEAAAADDAIRFGASNWRAKRCRLLSRVEHEVARHLYSRPEPKGD
jgi:hypothetical protein